MTTFAVDPELLTGFLLGLIRAGAWVAVSPPFSTRAVPVVVKVGLSAAIALPLAPALAASGPLPLDAGGLLEAAALQAGAGLALGFVAYVVFAAVQAAGNLVDIASGFAMGELIDPMSGSGASAFGRFYQLLATVLLFAIDGHLLLVRGFMASVDAAPLASPSLDALAAILTDGVGRFFLAALEIAAPLVAALFLAEVALALLARAAPQMNVLMVGFPLKVLVTLGVGGAAVTVLPGAVSNLVRPAVLDGARLFGG